MDEGQDNANKASGGSAAGAQGIFSTPELTVDTEKIAQNNTNNEKKRVASIFANTDAGQRSQKLNNAMGVSSQPITEDLVIQNGPKKKSKLPIILAVVVLIVVVGGLVGWMVMRNNDSSEISLSNAFDAYVNYLLFGKEDISPLSDTYNSSGDYTLYAIMSSDIAEQTEFSKHLTELSQTLQLALQKNKIISNEAKNELQLFFQSTLAWQQTFFFNDTLQIIQEVYEKDGDEAASKKAAELYAFLTSSQDDTIKEIGEGLINAQTARINFLKELNARGCKLSDTSDKCLDAISELEGSKYIEDADEVLAQVALKAQDELNKNLPMAWSISAELQKEVAK